MNNAKSEMTDISGSTNILKVKLRRLKHTVQTRIHRLVQRHKCNEEWLSA
jgi:hypothetical protein